MPFVTTAPPALPGCSSPLVEMQRALDIDSFWHSCRRLIGQVVPYSACSLFFDIDGLQPRRTRHHVSDRYETDFKPNCSLDVAGPYLAARPQHHFYTFNELAQVDPQAPSRWQAQVDRRYWDDFAQLAFWRDGKLEAVLGVGWDSRHDDIDASRLGLLEQMHPLIEAGLSRLHAMESERMRSEGLELALCQATLPAMLVGLDGGLLFANAPAQRLCGRWNDALRGRFRAMCLPEGIDELLEDVRQRGGVHAGDDARLVRHPCIEELSVRISTRWHASGLSRSPCHIVVFEDDRPPAPDQSRQRAQALLQKLSPKERRVALMVAEGMRNEEIATKLFRSRRTIEFQVASVYRKLEIGGRAQLIRLLA